MLQPLKAIKLTTQLLCDDCAWKRQKVWGTFKVLHGPGCSWVFLCDNHMIERGFALTEKK